jgi:imidazolonepropionase-like amidohydrolase
LSDDRPAATSKEQSIGEETRIHRSESVLTAAVDKETIMMDVSSGRYVGLDDIAGVIWQRLEMPRTFGDLVDSLVEDYDAERAVIAQDVRELLKEMAAQGVVGLD